MAPGIDNITIQSLWIGKQLSKVEQLCIKSFLDHGHQFHLYVYDEVENVPAGTTVIDARNILPEDQVFTFKEGWGKGSYAGFADYFRVFLVHKLGSWWVDMDVVCLRPFDIDREFILCSSFEGEWGVKANNCVFKAPAESSFLKQCVDAIEQTSIKEMNFGDAGPFLFQKIVAEQQLEDYLAPCYYFNPIYWRYINELLLGMQSAKERLKEMIRPIAKPATMPGRRIQADSYSVHLWNEVWRYNNFDKNGSYRYSSLFEQLKRKHGVR